jgi:hypothetical protein
MEGKYRLVDMFTIVAATLAPEDADTDIARFKTLKKQRDGLFHGDLLNESRLSAHDAVALLRRYVRLHLDASA